MLFYASVTILYPIFAKASQELRSSCWQKSVSQVVWEFRFSSFLYDGFRAVFARHFSTSHWWADLGSVLRTEKLPTERRLHCSKAHEKEVEHTPY
jgi:hypothetical protein